MPALCDWPARRVELRCAPCGRSGSYGVAGLLARFGPHASTHAVYGRLVATCRAGGACRAVMDVPAGTRVPSNPRSRS